MENTTLKADIQFAVGAVLVLGVSVFLLYDRLMNTDTFAAVVSAYGVTSIAMGVHMMEDSSAIHKFWKYLSIIIVSGAGFGIGTFASLPDLTVVSVASGIISLFTFVIHDIKHYAPQLPASFVQNSSLFVGGIIAVAQAIQANNPSSWQEIVSIIIATALAYYYQEVSGAAYK